jgi:hypothetical protein
MLEPLKANQVWLCREQAWRIRITQVVALPRPPFESDGSTVWFTHTGFDPAHRSDHYCWYVGIPAIHSWWRDLRPDPHDLVWLIYQPD